MVIAGNSVLYCLLIEMATTGLIKENVLRQQKWGLIYNKEIVKKWAKLRAIRRAMSVKSTNVPLGHNCNMKYLLNKGKDKVPAESRLHAS